MASAEILIGQSSVEVVAKKSIPEESFHDTPVEEPANERSSDYGGNVQTQPETEGDSVLSQATAINSEDLESKASVQGESVEGKDVGSTDTAETPDAPHEDRLIIDRLGAAINKAQAAATSPTALSFTANGNTVNRRFINVQFTRGPFCVVPWTACHSWQVVKVLLEEWYREESKALADINNGDVTIFCVEQGIVHPETWEQVVEHDSSIVFTPHSAFQQQDEASGQSQDSEPECENRVQYCVNYFEKTAQDTIPCFMAQKIFNDPIEFEVTNEHEKLPVLEEIKDVVVRQYDAVEKANENSNDKKSKLGAHDRVRDTILKINSLYLLNTIRSIVDNTNGENEGEIFGPGPGTFLHPYQELYWHISDFKKCKDDASGPRARHDSSYNQKCDEHINLLLGYLESQPDIPIKHYFAALQQKVPIVTFSTLWLLFKPGSDVYVREEDKSLNMYVVAYVRGGVYEKDGKKMNGKYRFGVWNLAFDGTYIGPVVREVEVDVFDHERKISELPILPVRFVDDTDGLKRRNCLISRGKKYFEYSKRPSFLQFSGKGLRVGSKTCERSRVIVDHASMPWHELDVEQTHHEPITETSAVKASIRVPRCECSTCQETMNDHLTYEKDRFSSYYQIVLKERTTALTEHHYLLMASHMYAFNLKDRAYDLLSVDGLEEPDIAEKAIDSLVMGKENKELIKAIAQTYTDSDQTRRFTADFIHGKGEGQIILLHGPPGTGKTLTAESVAEFTKRPLLSITAADLGVETSGLERNLLRYFERARAWDAIVLLDEADVYLEQRNANDLKRNSIVSVFLRALDYFQGILFLTTNRVGQFDEAFMSRIHLSLGYDKLDDKSREQIWENLFQKLMNDHKRGGLRIKYEWNAKEYVQSKGVQRLEWNGREIRNAFQTAVALAVYEWKHGNGEETPKVTEANLKQVVSMSSAFRKYMAATHQGLDESSLAFRRGNREDKYPSTPGKQD